MKKHHAGIVLGFVVLAGLLAILPAEQSATVVRFSEDAAMGRLALVDEELSWQDIDGLSGEAWQRFKKEMQEARGTITIPVNKNVVMLFFDPKAEKSDGHVNLSALDQFQHDDLLMLWLPFAKLSPQEVKRLQRHRELKLLMLGPLSTYGDETLAPLARMTWLEALEVPEADVTDAGLRRLAHLTKLKKLTLYGTKVTDSGMKYIAAMTQLRELNLGMTKLDGSGLEQLKKLRYLRKLVLWRTGVCDADLSLLARFEKLEELDLKETKTTDAGLRHLNSHKHLRRIDLSYTRITDAGLEELETVPNLDVLLLLGTSVTEAGVARLKQKRPGIDVLLTDPALSKN